MSNEVHERIYSTFSSVASTLGYSEVHGRIISALLVAGKPLSLQEIKRITTYSLASVSLSLDLLEILGVVKKIKKKGDRKVYARLDGDLLDALRNALVIKLQKDIARTLNEYDDMKKQQPKNRKIIQSVEKELRRLNDYVNRLSKVPIPKR